MKLSSMLRWTKRLIGRPEASGEFKLGYGVAEPNSRMGKSAFSDAIEKALAAVGARPGDIVEVNEHGAARVVGRRPHLAGEPPHVSAQAIRTTLRKIYGDDVASLANVMAGANVVVFRNPAQN